MPHPDSHTCGNCQASLVPEDVTSRIDWNTYNVEAYTHIWACACGRLDASATLDGPRVVLRFASHHDKIMHEVRAANAQA